MSRTIKVIVRDLDEQHTIDLGEFSLYDIQPLVELYKNYGAYMPDGRAEFVGAQMVPEENAVEIVMKYCNAKAT